MILPDKNPSDNCCTLPQPRRYFPSILSANIRSTMNKIDEIYLTISSGNYQIFAASETWLTNEIPNELVRFPNYHVFRCDRLLRSGGGVCAWVHSSLNVICLSQKEKPDFLESVWLAVPSSKIIFSCIYIPPDMSVSKQLTIDDYIISNVDEFLTKFPDYDLIITGDLNKFKLRHISQSLDLVSLVNEPTRGSSVLDHFLISSSISSDYKVSVTAPIANSDHNSISAMPESFTPLRIPLFKPLYDLRQSNVDCFLHCLSRINWTDFYLSADDLDRKCNVFHEILSGLVRECIPVTYVELCESDKPWITPLIKYAIQKRWDAYREKKFMLFNHWKVKCKSLILTAKRRWASNAQQSVSQFWKLVGSVVSGKSRDGAFSMINQFRSVAEAVESVNEEFSSVFTQESSTSTSDAWDTNNFRILERIVEISPIDVWRLLMQTSPFKAMGSDMIPTVLYKEAASLLAEPLAHIYNISLSQQQFPTLWKMAHVCPIPKSFPPNIKSLRPIALLPLPSKILEKLILKSCHDGLLECFGDYQYGSRPKSSTTCAVISLMHSALSKLELAEVSGIQIVTYDYSKAFDVLSHNLVIQRLREAKFSVPIIKWIQAYLTNRMQAVRIGATLSTYRPVTSGVPQGSVLGPLLFCIVVAGLRPLYEDTRLIKYVDDTTICCPLYRDRTNDYITKEHQHILEWSAKNGFKINLKKCKCILFKKSQDDLNVLLSDVANVNQLQFLGVTLNNHLNWSSHVEDICARASRRIYGLRVMKNINVSKEKMVLAYNAVVRSLLEYASPSFGQLPSNLRDRLERVQRRCHRVICGLPRGMQCDCGMFEELDSRRITASLRLFQKASKTDHILHAIMPPRSKHSKRHIQPVSFTTRYRNSFVPHATFLSNNSFS